MAKKLSAKRQRFVEEYLVDLNATQAAIRAGYSKKTAYSIGNELLSIPEIQEAVSVAKAARSERTEITADWVLRQLATVAGFDLTEVFEQDDQKRLLVRDITSLPKHLTGAIESITQTSTETWTEDGVAVEKVRLQVKAHSKLGALKMLFDHLGMSAPQQVEQTVSLAGLPGGLTREQIRERALRMEREGGPKGEGSKG